MVILKEAEASQVEQVSAEDLALIHQQSRKELKEEEIYTFSVRLCDNQVDRDFDRFTKGTLEELSALFVGKSGIFDHSWTAKGQACRIYKTEVVEESPVDEMGYGEGSYFLKAFVYMIRTASNEDLIAEIEAGIKKEVSVGCAVSQSLCSICGEDIGRCSHNKGETYDQGLCYSELIGATDAYEFSFVAVPAQQKAGVMKQMQVVDLTQGEGALPPGVDLKNFDLLGLLASTFSGGCLSTEQEEELVTLKGQLQTLQEQAKIGRNCLEALQKEVTRLGCLSHVSISNETMEKLVKKLDSEELSTLKTAFEEKAAEKIPLKTQLRYGGESATVSDGAFMI